MKKYTFLIALFASASICFGQNLIDNGDFETGMLAPDWGGFNNQVVTDALTNSYVGNGNNAEASIFQEFTVTPGETYNVAFQYRWVSGTGNYACTVRIKDARNLPTNLDLVGSNASNGYVLKDTADVWYDASFSFTPPAGIDSVRILFYKANGNRPLRIDNVSVTQSTTSLTELEQFHFTAYPNPVKDILHISAENNIDKVELFNMLGEQVINQPANSNRVQVNVASLSKGIYLVKTHIGRSVGSYKLIKE